MYIDKLLDLFVALIQGVLIVLITFYAIEKNAKKIEIRQNQVQKSFSIKGTGEIDVLT